MRIIKALLKLQEHPILQNFTLNDISQYARLVGHLKNDILLPQPLDQSDASMPPDILPRCLLGFFSGVMGIEEGSVQDSWDILKHCLWECEPIPLTAEDYTLFRDHGFSRGIVGLTIYSKESVCTNECCPNVKPLKKETSRRVVVYTLENGVLPGWAIHLYCPACNTDYHNNFTVHGGKRTYYQEVPHYVQVGEHQFIEQTVIHMWINNMLIAWVSASNAAKAYQMSLTKDYLAETEWQFGSVLTTEQVWDAFLIVCLLDDKIRCHQSLQVPHTGLQKDWFTDAMDVRNKDFIYYGQPNAVDHACDKSLRVYQTDNGEICQCHPIVGDGLSIGQPCCTIFACPEPLQNNCHRYCKIHFDEHNVCAVLNCKAQTTPDLKMCSDLIHKQFEKKNKEKGASNFILKECFWNSQASQPVDTLNMQEIHQAEDVEETTMEWFEVDDNTGAIHLRSKPNPGTIGTEDDANLQEPCPSKLATGNQSIKAQFG